MNNFNVYVIHSSKPLEELKATLEEAGGYVHAGIIYKSLRRGLVSKKEETRKTIVFCPKSTIENLVASHPEYKEHVADYCWETFPMPNFEKKETWDLHVSGLPNDFTVKEASDFVNKTLSNLLTENDYRLDFATRLRETGEIHGYGHIIFNKTVDHDKVKLCKLILHNTPILSKGKEKRMITCTWHIPAQPVAVQKKEVYSVRKMLEKKGRAQPAILPQVDLSGIGEVEVKMKTMSQ